MQFQEGLEDSPFKRIRIAQTSFCSEVPNLSFLPKDGIEKLHRIGSLTAKSSWAIQFLLKICLRNRLRM
jgi:hypothetical protein